MNTEQPDFAIFSLKVFYSLGALSTFSLKCCGLLLAQGLYCTHLFLVDFIKYFWERASKPKVKVKPESGKQKLILVWRIPSIWCLDWFLNIIV